MILLFSEDAESILRLFLGLHYVLVELVKTSA